VTSDCQRKIVSVNGMTPVIGSSAGGMLAGLACSSAADEDSPSAQMLPSPR
jgi:acetyl esterase/lipase